MARYYESKDTQPISQFVELPLEFMQGQLDKRQLKRDANVASGTSTLGLDPSQYSSTDTQTAQERDAAFNESLSGIVNNVMGDDWSSAPGEIQKLKQQYGVTKDVEGNPIYRAGTTEDLITTNKSTIDEYKKNIDSVAGKDITQATAWYNFNKNMQDYDAAGGAATGTVFNATLPSANRDFWKEATAMSNVFNADGWEGALQAMDPSGHYIGTLSGEQIENQDVASFYSTWLQNQPEFLQQAEADFAFANNDINAIYNEDGSDYSDAFKQYYSDQANGLVEQFAQAIDYTKYSKQYQESFKGKAYGSKLIKDLDGEPVARVSGGGYDITTNIDNLQETIKANTANVLSATNKAEDTKAELYGILTSNIPGSTTTGSFEGFIKSFIPEEFQSFQTTDMKAVDNIWNNIVDIGTNGDLKLKEDYKATLELQGVPLEKINEIGTNIDNKLSEYNTYNNQKIAYEAEVATQTFIMEDIDRQMESHPDKKWTDDKWQTNLNAYNLSKEGLVGRETPDMTMEEFKTKVKNNSIEAGILSDMWMITGERIDYNKDVKDFVESGNYVSSEVRIASGKTGTGVGSFNNAYTDLFYNKDGDRMNTTELSKLTTTDGTQLLQVMQDGGIDMTSSPTVHYSSGATGALATITASDMEGNPKSFIVDVQSNPEMLSSWRNAVSVDYATTVNKLNYSNLSTENAETAIMESEYGGSLTAGQLPLNQNIVDQLPNIGNTYDFTTSDAVLGEVKWTVRKDNNVAVTLIHHGTDEDGNPVETEVKNLGDNDAINKTVGKVHLLSNTKLNLN